MFELMQCFHDKNVTACTRSSLGQSRDATRDSILHVFSSARDAYLSPGASPVTSSRSEGLISFIKVYIYVLTSPIEKLLRMCVLLVGCMCCLGGTSSRKHLKLNRIWDHHHLQTVQEQFLFILFMAVLHQQHFCQSLLFF